MTLSDHSNDLELTKTGRYCNKLDHECKAQRFKNLISLII